MGHMGDAPSTLPTVGYALPDAQAEGWPERENGREALLVCDESFQATGEQRWKCALPTTEVPDDDQEAKSAEKEECQGKVMSERESMFTSEAEERPSAARIYDYLLGGYHNFEVDRVVAKRFRELLPSMPLFMQANRTFLRRVVTFL